MKNTANDEAASDGGFGPEAGHLAGRIACLAEFMTADRYAVLRRTVAGRTRYMTVLAENMFHGQNAAALVRHCEAFGIQEMHTVESLCPFEPSAAVVRGTDRWVDIRRHRSTDDALAALTVLGYSRAQALAALKEINPDYEDMTKAIDLYIHKLDSGEEVPPVTLEEQSPDLAFIQSQALKGRKTKPVAAKAPAPKAAVTTKKSPSAVRKSAAAGTTAKK